MCWSLKMYVCVLLTDIIFGSGTFVGFLIKMPFDWTALNANSCSILNCHRIVPERLTSFLGHTTWKVLTPSPVGRPRSLYEFYISNYTYRLEFCSIIRNSMHHIRPLVICHRLKPLSSYQSVLFFIFLLLLQLSVMLNLYADWPIVNQKEIWLNSQRNS